MLDGGAALLADVKKKKKTHPLARRRCAGTSSWIHLVQISPTPSSSSWIDLVRMDAPSAPRRMNEKLWRYPTFRPNLGQNQTHPCTQVTHTRRRASDCYQASGGVPPGGEPPGNGSTTGLPSMVGTHFPICSSKCCPSRATSCSRNRGLAAAPNCTVVGAATSDCRQRKSSGGAAVAGTSGG